MTALLTASAAITAAAAATDPRTGRMLGQYLKELGEKLLGAAADAEQLAAETERRRLARADARKAAEAAARAVEAGLAPDQAIQLIAARRGLDPDRVRGWFQIDQKKPAAKARLRNVKILRLARRGWSDRDIAAKYGLSTKHVNRIVRRMLREHPPEIPQPPAR